MLQKCFGHGGFPLSPLRYSVCLDGELSVGGLPQCSFISTQENVILDTSELSDNTNTISETLKQLLVHSSL